MHFNVYLIDDDSVKAAMLPHFLQWMTTQFPGVIFNVGVGFENPVKASANPDLIWAALQDPNGLVLLDLLLPGDTRIAASDTLLLLAGKTVEDRAPIWRILHHHVETKLAASIVCSAHDLSSRIIWITTQDMDRSLHAELGCLPTQYPPIPWPHSVDTIFWEERHVDLLAPLIESGFRKDYLTVAKIWEAAGVAVCEARWALNDGDTSILFPMRMDEHNVSGHSQNCRTANAQETENLLTPLFERLSMPLPDPEERLFILKGVSRGGEISGRPNAGTQLYVTTLLKAFRVNGKASLFPNWVARFTQSSPGAVLLAASTLSGVDNAPEIGVELDDPELTIALVFSYKDELAAKDALATFKLTPRQRMDRDKRSTPGTVVLALDYLRPFEIEQSGTYVTITIKRPAQPVS